MKKKVLAIVLTMLVCVCLGAIFIFSILFSTQKYGGFLASMNEFYFVSDILYAPQKEMEYTVSNYNFEDKIEFSIHNYEDDFRKAQEDVVYEIAVYIENMSGDMQLVENVLESVGTNDFILRSNESEDDYLLHLKEEHFHNRLANIQIVATSTTPFKKVLQANIKVYLPFKDASLQVHDEVGKEYFELEVSTYDRGGSLCLQYSDTLYVDQNNQYILRDMNVERDAVGVTNEVCLGLREYSNSKITFFKENRSDIHGVTDFTIKE